MRGTTGFLVLMSAWFAAGHACAEEPFFRFLDDFQKAAEEQRDPYEERIETERHDFTQ